MDSQEIQKPNPFSQLMNIKTKDNPTKKKRKVSESKLAILSRKKNLAIGRFARIEAEFIALIYSYSEELTGELDQLIINDIKAKIKYLQSTASYELTKKIIDDKIERDQGFAQRDSRRGRAHG